MNLTEMKQLIENLLLCDEGGISETERDRFLRLVAVAEAAMEVEHDDRCNYEFKEPCTCGVGRLKEALTGVTR